MNGGWSANEEATPNFDDIINNMMMGHEWLNEEFGFQPKIGWDIDTFGHSDTNTRLFAQMGFEALFFSRMSYDEKGMRNKQENQSMNFVWKPSSKHFGDQYAILTNVFKTDYCYPTGFYSSESYESDDPFVDDESLSTFNAKEKLVELVNYINGIAYTKKGQNIFIPFGCDFSFQNARADYQYLERLMSYASKHNTANMKFVMSTPSDYVDAVKKENVTWPVRYGDTYPYAETANDYWNGYYSSRAGAKKQVKDASALHNAESKLFAQRVIKEGVSDQEVAAVMDAKKRMLKALGLYLHHDAIAGTAKQYVANDYKVIMGKAEEASLKEYRKELENALYLQTGIELTNDVQFCGTIS